MFPVEQGVGTQDTKVLVLAATNTPYSLDQVSFSACINFKHFDVIVILVLQFNSKS
jgi:hypothetical protein